MKERSEAHMLLSSMIQRSGIPVSREGFQAFCAGAFTYSPLNRTCFLDSRQREHKGSVGRLICSQVFEAGEK